MNQSAPFRQRMLATEKRLAIRYIIKAAGCITQAAQLSGIHRSQLRRIIVRHGLQSMITPATYHPSNQHGNAAWRALADA